MQYFFRATVAGEIGTWALVSEYTAPNTELLRTSSGALIVCQYMGQDCLRVISAKSIMSVVGMVPYPHGGLGPGQWFFLVEKMGLVMAHFRGDEEVDEQEEQGEHNGDGGDEGSELEYV